MTFERLKPYLILVVFGLGIYVALVPGITFAPTPRVVLFFIISTIPALLFGSEIQSRFQVSLPGFIFSVAGAGAIFFGALFLLDHLAKPEVRIAVFSFYDEDGEELYIDAPGILEVKDTHLGLSVNNFSKKNTLILIFPEQVPEVEVAVRKIFGGKVYRRNLSYSGNRKMNLTLGKELN
jgi:hypothetical protein